MPLPVVCVFGYDSLPVHSCNVMMGQLVCHSSQPRSLSQVLTYSCDCLVILLHSNQGVNFGSEP